MDRPPLAARNLITLKVPDAADIEELMKKAANMPKGEKFKIPEDNPAAKAYAEGGDYVNIPQVLRDPATSQMTFEVKAGEQTHNITLKDVGEGKGSGSGKGSSKGF